MEEEAIGKGFVKLMVAVLISGIVIVGTLVAKSKPTKVVLANHLRADEETTKNLSTFLSLRG